MPPLSASWRSVSTRSGSVVGTWATGKEVGAHDRPLGKRAERQTASADELEVGGRTPSHVGAQEHVTALPGVVLGPVVMEMLRSGDRPPGDDFAFDGQRPRHEESARRCQSDGRPADRRRHAMIGDAGRLRGAHQSSLQIALRLGGGDRRDERHRPDHGNEYEEASSPVSRDSRHSFIGEEPMDVAALAADHAVAGRSRPFDVEHRRQPSVHLRLAAIEGVVLAHEAAQRLDRARRRSVALRCRTC